MVSLRLIGCKYVLQLPPLGLLPFLKELTIIELDGIVGVGAEFHGSSSSSFTCLETLYFYNMKEWEEWDCETPFPRLQHLSIVHCPKLKGLPNQLLHVKQIIICECERFTISGHNTESSTLERIGDTINNNSLEVLHIYSCLYINIPLRLRYNLLVTLDIDGGFDSPMTFPLDFFPKLCSLKLRCCNLQMISQDHTHNHLKDLDISKSPQFESFPMEGLSAPKLVKFSIKELKNLKLLPKRMDILLPSLTDIRILDCPQAELCSDGGLPSNLNTMDLSDCSKFMASMKMALGANNSLEVLSVQKLDVESFPDEGFLPFSLTSLEISNCLDLKNLDYSGLCHLSSLQELLLFNCPNLRCLPEEGLPESISELKIVGCPLLEQCGLKPKGLDWEKIVHLKT